MTDSGAAIQELLTSRPGFHATTQDWGLEPQALEWLAANVQPGWRTIETGCGLTTALLTLKGADHICIAPDTAEHEAVREWCRDRGFSGTNLTSVIDRSQCVLPLLSTGPVDIAVIDGGHAFPVPFIDWFYLAERLKPDGCVLVDDTHLRAPRILSEFLSAEAPRWGLEREFSRACVYRKLDDIVVPDNDWVGQRWSRPNPYRRMRGRARRWLNAALVIERLPKRLPTAGLSGAP